MRLSVLARLRMAALHAEVIRAGLLLTALAGLMVHARPVAAQWTPLGVPLCVECAADFPTDHLVISDAVGGLFAARREILNRSGTGTDVFLQRVTGAGYIASGWPTNGLGICVAERDQIAAWTATDGQGGALVTWIDQRGDNDIYVQRVKSDGTLSPGWPVNGAPACRAPWSQYVPVVEPDGQGGAFVAWVDDRNYLSNVEDIYAQHLGPNGSVFGGWPADGLPIVNAPELQYFPALISDGQGGVVVVWTDLRAEGRAMDVRGVRVGPDGTVAPEWGTGDKILLAGRGRVPSLVADHAGGFYLICSTESQTNPGFADELWVQRFSMNGEVAPGWPTQGLLVCQAPGPRDGRSVAPDGAGGLLMTWYDYRIPGGVVYAARVLPSGTVAPGWTPNGTLLSNPIAPGVEYDPAIAPDGAGGAYVVWNIEYDGTPAFVQHLTAQGRVAPGWPPYGVRVAPTNSQLHPQIVSDGKGGAIVVWDEASAPRFGLFAQRFQLDGPVPALVSLASAEAKPGFVRLVWQGTDAARLEFRVERRTESNVAWNSIGTLLADATGRMTYDDRAVEAGTRYGYRLRWHENGAERFTTEAWVDVSEAASLALDGLRPNPAVGNLDVSFTLAESTPARIEVLDLAGRQLRSQEFNRGAGRHVVRLGSASDLPPGVYWLRLTQGSDQRLARGVVAR